MRIFVFPPHPNSARVLSVLYELKIEADVVPLDIFKGETQTPEFLAINPRGTVPALSHGDLLLWESRAILGYLASQKPDADLCPSDPAIRALVDQWLFWLALELYPAMDQLVTEKVVNPAMGRPTDKAVAEEAMGRVSELLPFIETGLGGNDGLAGPVTIADFDLVVLLSQRVATGIDFSRLPDLNRCIASMESRPGVQKAVTPARAAFGQN